MSTTAYLKENMLRLSTLHGLDVLDSGTEAFYDDITQLTADICDTPICLISLVEDDRQWFKSEVGLGICETKLEQSICAHAVQQDSYLEVSDTHLDSRTIDNTLCQGSDPIRFYAGAILRSLEGWPLGTLCVLDYKPRELTNLQRRTLEVNATSVIRHLELTQLLRQRGNIEEQSHKNDLLPDETLSHHQHIHAAFETLTPREKEVLSLIAGHSTSLTSKEIAKELSISFRTVHHHRAKIMAKMNVKSVAELIAVTIKAKVFTEARSQN